jgi:hypothetical protein
MPQGKNPKFWIILWHTICKGCKSFIFNGLQTSRLNAHRAFFRHRLIQLPYPIFRVCKSFVFNSLTFRVLAFLAHVSVFCCFCQFSDYRVIDRAKNIFWIFRNIFPQDTCVGCINFNAMRQNPTIWCYGSKVRLCVFFTLSFVGIKKGIRLDALPVCVRDYFLNISLRTLHLCTYAMTFMANFAFESPLLNSNMV